MDCKSKKTFRELVQAYDEKIYSSQCSGWPDKCLKFFAQRGDWRNVRLAIKKGASNSNLGMRGAAHGGHKDLVEFFIEKEANDWEEGLNGAVHGGHLDLVKFFFGKGAGDLNSVMPDAVAYADLEMIDFFIENGADPNMGMGQAAARGDLDLVKFFLERGANNLNRAIRRAKAAQQYAIVDYLEQKQTGLI